MNYDFFRLLDSAKSMDNASKIEALKRLYLACELKNDPELAQEGAAKFVNDGGTEFNGTQVSDTCYVFDCENGKVKLTLADRQTVVIEASPTGTDDMYRVVGKVGVETSLNDALKVGTEALNDEALMEGLVGDMMQKGADAVKSVGKKVGKAAATAAMAASPLLVGCAGTPSVDLTPHEATIDYVAQEYGINPTESNDGNQIIPNLVQAITNKITEQTKAISEKSPASEGISIAKAPATQEAKDIYKMLKDGTIKVNNNTLDPERHTQEMAQADAANAFARGLRQNFHNSIKVEGEEFLKELN